jgi:hypothetical protein
MFYFAPSNLPLDWLAAGLIRIRKSTLWKADGCVPSVWLPSRQRLGRTLPAGRRAEKWCAQKQLIYRADFLSPSQKSCTFLRELCLRDKVARIGCIGSHGSEARQRFPAELPPPTGFDPSLPVDASS